MRFAALAFFFGPLLVLVAAGVAVVGRERRRPWRAVVGLVAISTVAWLGYVGLYQHETPCSGRSTNCPTVYGYYAPLEDEHPLGTLLLLAGFAIPAAWSGWRRLAPALTVGASLAVGPTLLAGWSAPRGDNDGLWTLVFLYLPAFGGLAAIVAAVAERIGAARRAPDERSETEAVRIASPADRLAALAIDVAVIGGGLVVPLTALSHAKLEVPAVLLGVTVATSYLAVPLAWRGRTLGQSLVGVSVFDQRSNARLGLPRAFLRSLIVVLEIVGTPTLVLALPALAELLALGGSGRTLTDRFLRTSVVSSHRSATAASRPGPKAG